MEQRIIKRILAIDPFSRGVGFAVLEGPEELIDWGLKTTGRADNRKAVRIVETLIDRFQPDMLALENWMPQAPAAAGAWRPSSISSRTARGKGFGYGSCSAATSASGSCMEHSAMLSRSSRE